MFTKAPIPSNETERRQALLKYQLLDTRGESKFDNVTQLVAEIFGAKIVLISLVDSYRQWFKSKVGLDACELDRDSSFCGHAILQRDVFYIENALLDDRFAGNPLVVKPPYIRTYAGAPIMSEDGYGVGTLCIIYDQVTPLSSSQLVRLKSFATIVQDLATSRLNRLILQAERERQRQLISMLSHELRTPLASLQMMQREQNLQCIEPFGGVMMETTDHLGLILEDMVSILDPTRVKMSKQDDSVFSVIERTSNSLRYLLQNFAITLHFHGDADAKLICHFDTQALRQLATNLIKNCAIHSGASDLWLTIQTQTSAPDEVTYLISVADNGRGVPVDHQAKLFDAGFRGNTRADGSGLGLYICQDLVSKLDGSLEYCAAKQGGAEFNACIRLKRATFERDAIDTNQDQQSVTPTLIASVADKPVKQRVLLAEDNNTIRMFTEFLLMQLGVDVVGVENGAEALAVISEGQFDLVLTDIYMPEVDGYTLTQSLRSLGYKGKIVGVSAHEPGDEHATLLALGADAVLTKPVDKGQLAQFLN